MYRSSSHSPYKYYTLSSYSLTYLIPIPLYAPCLDFFGFFFRLWFRVYIWSYLAMCVLFVYLLRLRSYGPSYLLIPLSAMLSIRCSDDFLGGREQDKNIFILTWAWYLQIWSRSDTIDSTNFEGRRCFFATNNH
ncbi:hypothetical protein B0H19DRAFT_495120 [Mycena capillaripes]|nr:hypothetical protein B0H19DRAFT_495120 [Mycena capillaripes]